MFIGAEDFFESFVQVRDVFITGRKGSGKTLLAFAMAGYALDNHFVKGVFANIPHSFPVSPSVKDSFTIVDESWQFIDNRMSAATFSFMGAWSRKTNTLWAFPSVYGVDKRVRNLEVERIADINLLPVRLWIFRWHNCWGDKGMFGLLRPERYYGTYDTKAIPVDDGGAVDSLLSFLPSDANLVQRVNRRGGRNVGKEVNVSASGNGHSGVDTREIWTRILELERVNSELAARVDQLAGIAAGPPESSAGGLRYGV